MAWILQIARIEWTPEGESITATEIGTRVFDYFPASPAVEMERTAGARRGSRPVAHTVPNVRESARVSLAGAPDRWTAYRALETALERALLWAEDDRRDMRAVLRFRDTARHDANTFFEAPLVNGSVELDRGPTVRLTWERGPYWSGAETLLPVRNAWTQYSGEVEPDEDGYAEYALVTNADDDNPLRNNHVFVSAPEGDVGAPMRIRIQNNYTSGRLRTVRMGWTDRPQQLLLEAEDAEGVSSTYDETRSGRGHATSAAFRWVIEQNTTRDLTGMFRIYANGNLRGASWRIANGYALTRMQYGSRVAMAGSNGWTDLGLLSFPPGGYAHPLRHPVTVWLEGDAEGTLDFLLFVPQVQYRRLTFQGYNCVPGACIEDDGWRGETVYEFDGQRLRLLDVYGAPLEARPALLLPHSQEQMLVFALEGDGGDAKAERSAMVQCFARPHYRTLP